MQAIRTLLILAIFTAVGFGVYSCSESEPEVPAIPALDRGLLSDPESLDVHKARSTQAAEVLRDIGEGLMSYSASGELVGGVAESWSVAEDGRSYTFKLREEARWSNGETVTAEHFVFALRRLVDPVTAAFYAQAVEAITNARDIISGDAAPETLGVAAADEQTLVINLEQPTPYLLNLLTHPSTFPLHPNLLAEHGDDFTRPEFLLSNGAYKLGRRPGSCRP
jgi:oligopeptide transport system substrate-binding protein